MALDVAVDMALELALELALALEMAASGPSPARVRWLKTVLPR